MVRPVRDADQPKSPIRRNIAASSAAAVTTDANSPSKRDRSWRIPRSVWTNGRWRCGWKSIARTQSAVTSCTALQELHRNRLGFCYFAIKNNSFEKIGGKGEIIEADETFVGGLAKNMHKSRRAREIKGTGSSTKTAVMGLLARHTEDAPSEVRAVVLSNVQRQTLHDVIHKNVEPGSQVFTDA